MSALYDYGNGELGDYGAGGEPRSASTSLPGEIPHHHRWTTWTSTWAAISSPFAATIPWRAAGTSPPLTSNRRSRVCVLGSYVADSLFNYADPIGETVYFGGEPFTVVGTYYQKDGGAEGSMDDMAAIPYYPGPGAYWAPIQLTQLCVSRWISPTHMDTVMAKLGAVSWGRPSTRAWGSMSWRTATPP